MIVVDASIVVTLLTQPSTTTALADRLLASHETVGAPELLDVEVLHAVRRLLRMNEISSERATAVIDDLGAIRIDRYPHATLVPRIWSLRERCTAYDAAYVALAQTLDATLLTADRRLARSVTSLLPVEVYPAR